mgnify:CR=1 FL=1
MHRKVFGNIPGALVIAFYTIIPVMVIWGAFMFANRMKNWERGAPAQRHTTSKNAAKRLKDFRAGAYMQTLLRDAGYKGEEFAMMADNTNRPHIDTATVVSEQLRAVGVNVKLTVTDWPTIFTARTKPEGWCMWPLLMGIEPYEGPYGVVGFFAGQTSQRGYLTFGGDDRQRQYVRDGWNLTGDSFWQDEDGRFHFAARSDDMIISAGYNIAGPEVEAALLSHPDVVECAVIGCPDEERGQIVEAHVVLAADQAGDALMVKLLQDHVKSGIAPYKYPRRVVFTDALPKTQTGKIQRFRLRG